jgi:hypothetical protein
MVRTLEIPYDDSVLLATSLPQADFEREAKLLLAAKLFDLGRLSSGKAAQLCGMGRVEFLASLQRVDDGAAKFSVVSMRPTCLKSSLSQSPRL